MMKIIVADDHALVRRGVKEVIAEEFDLAVIKEIGTGQGVVNAVQEEEWDIVILDLNFPDTSGLKVLKKLKAFRPVLPFVVLSVHPEEQYAVRALKAGASGYVTKATVTEELIGAMNKALTGGTYVSSTLAEQFAKGAISSRVESSTEGLSDRELEVLCLFGKGEMPSQIAKRLNLSIKTVSTYRARLLEKLNLKTSAQLIRYAVTHQLLD